MIGKQVLAFRKSEKSEIINIRIFAASSGGRKGRRHIGRFTPDRERSHVWRPAKTQISLGICSVWSESSLCTQWVAKDPSFLHADSEDSDQTGWMPRLIWVFAGHTITLLVLSCRGSYFLIFARLWVYVGVCLCRCFFHDRSKQIFYLNNNTIWCFLVLVIMIIRIFHGWAVRTEKSA